MILEIMISKQCYITLHVIFVHSVCSMPGFAKGVGLPFCALRVAAENVEVAELRKVRSILKNKDFPPAHRQEVALVRRKKNGIK